MATHVIVDCEASGPCPEFGCMIEFGAFVAEPSLSRGFKSRVIEPYCERYVEAAYASIGFTLAEHKAKSEYSLADAMVDFDTWLTSLAADRVVFWSDNPAFDWQWINHGFAVAGIRNPFGHSGRRISDLYAGLKRNPGNTQGWKKLRKTVHDHNPLNDAKGNAEAMLAFLEEQQIKWLK